MDTKKIIHIICAIGSALSVFFITRYLSLLVIVNALGNTAYAISAPLMLPLEILAALVTIWLFVPQSNTEEELDEAELEESFEESFSEEPTAVTDFDESAYPELFNYKGAKKESLSFDRPDISSIIHQQGGEVEDVQLPEEKEDILGKIAETKSADYSLYEDLPSELPEDYVPYEYEEEPEDEDYEEEYELPVIPPLVTKAVALFTASLLAIFLPFNAATVYTLDAVTIRRPFSVKEYAITDAEYYTIGVKLSGDASMKLHYKNGHEQELIFSAAIKSKEFTSSFSSEYAYAAFCSRLLKRSGKEKRFDDLTSLSPNASLSDSDLAYIEEITETKFND